MKIKFNSDDSLPLKKAEEFHDLIEVLRYVFNDNNKCYPQVFMDYLRKKKIKKRKYEKNGIGICLKKSNKK